MLFTSSLNCLPGLKAGTIGHKVGDELITGASECLSTAFNGIDTIYRIGGDEFCIIITESIEKTLQCVSRLDELTANWQGHYIDSLSISCGVASIKDHDDVESVFAEADKKMYAYKSKYYTSIGVDRCYH